MEGEKKKVFKMSLVERISIYVVGAFIQNDQIGTVRGYTYFFLYPLIF